MTGKEIRELRIKMMLSQVEFAKLMGVHKDTVSSWEREKNIPRPLHQRNLARLQRKIGK